MEKTIILDNGKSVVVSKLPIKKYSELLLAIKELPKHLNDLDGLKNEDIIAKVPELIAYALPDIVNIINVATQLPNEEIEELGAREVTDLFIGIFEVNQYTEVYEKIKKALARPVVPVEK